LTAFNIAFKTSLQQQRVFNSDSAYVNCDVFITYISLFINTIMQIHAEINPQDMTKTLKVYRDVLKPWLKSRKLKACFPVRGKL